MSKLDLYKQHLLQILESAAKNPEHADDLVDQLLLALDEHFIDQNRYEKIEIHVNTINNRLAIIEESFKKEGVNFYKKIKDEELQNSLIDFYASYRQAISNGNFPLACKNLFQQLETLLNYLIHKKDLIDVIIRGNKSGFYFLEQKDKYYKIDLSNKIRLVSDYYKTEFSKMSTP